MSSCRRRHGMARASKKMAGMELFYGRSMNDAIPFIPFSCSTAAAVPVCFSCLVGTSFSAACCWYIVYQSIDMYIFLYGTSFCWIGRVHRWYMVIALMTVQPAKIVIYLNIFVHDIFSAMATYIFLYARSTRHLSAALLRTSARSS